MTDLAFYTQLVRDAGAERPPLHGNLPPFSHCPEAGSGGNAFRRILQGECNKKLA